MSTHGPRSDRSAARSLLARAALPRGMPGKEHIAIIGRGNVGSALKSGLERIGHKVDAVGNEGEKVRKVTKDAEIVFLAVPFGARRNALEGAGMDAMKGKILVDVTNPLAEDGQYALDPRNDSSAEQVQGWADEVRVVKAFNTIFAQQMTNGQVDSEPLSVFVAGDDTEARERVMVLARDMGYDPVDSGTLENARWLESLGMLNITLGYGVKHGTDIGFRLVRQGAAQGSRPREPVAKRS